MLKKLSIGLSVAAVLGLGLAVTTSDAVFAKNNHPTKHVSKSYKSSKKVYVKHSSKHYVVGHKYGGHVYYGHRRHYWHGRWYEYGVGPCWINVGGVWFWNLLVCP
jgi:hypothetical protein